MASGRRPMSQSVTPMPPRPTTVHGFAEMDVISPADVLRRHLDVFHSTGTLPSLKPRRRAVTPMPYDGAPFRAADMVKVGIDRAHRLTPSKSSPSKRNISSIMVLYTHDSRFLKTDSQAVKKVTAADLEPLAQRSGFVSRELLQMYKVFQKHANPTTKGVDVPAFAEFMHRFGGADPHDEFIMQRLFEYTNTRGAFYVTFEQCVETLRVIKKGDASAKAELYFKLIDTSGNGWISMDDIMVGAETRPMGDGHLNIMKERRKITTMKVAGAAFKQADKNPDQRITLEDLLGAVRSNNEVRRFFERLGFL